MMTWQMGIQFVMWSIFGLVWLWMMPKSRKDEHFVRKNTYNGSLWITIPLSLLVWTTGWSAMKPIFPGQETAGVIIGVFGLASAIYARLVLGHFWDIHAAGHKEGKLLEVFPYTRIRHPIYGAQIIFCFGTGLSCNNIAACLILVPGTYLLLLQRAIHEEALLNELTGGDYQARFEKKGRFFPCLPETNTE